MMEELISQRPVRIILLKARQWGGSTLVQIFMAWVQIFHRKGWHSVIVADVEEQSRNIRAMYSRLALYHPKEIFDVKFKNFEGSSKNKIMERRDGVIYIGSMQKPDALRSADVMMAHLSEVGLWRATEGKRPEDVVQSIAG
ncbi:MAG: terminase, partial [Rikenellaceae bacterium]